jgi:hypothetical protein
MKSYMKKSLLVSAMMGAITGCNIELSQEEVDKLTSENYDGEGVSTGEVTRKDANTITVNGIKFNISQASINLDGQTGSQDQIKLGQIVTITADYNSDGTATASLLTYDDSLQGPVDSVNVQGKSLVVLGQTILVDSETLFDGVTLETVEVGQILEVSGLSNAQGQWQASYIGLSDQGITEFDTLGVVSDLDAAAMTFKVNGLAVDYSQVRELNEVQQWLANDAFINLYGTMTQANDGSPVLLAAEIESEETMMGDDGDLREIEGLITSAFTDGKFEVSGVTVIINEQTEFDFGDASLLVVDALVEVEGTVNSDGTITAEYLFVEPENLIEVAAVIEAIDVENNTLTIMGKTFTLNDSTLITNDDMGEMDDEEWNEDWDEDDYQEYFNEGDMDLGDFEGADFNEEDFNEEDFNEGDFNEEDWNESDDMEGGYDDEFSEDDWQENISTIALSDLAIGDYIEVVAYQTAEDQPLVALYVGKMENEENDEVYLSAQIDSIELTHKTITVMGETIDLTASGLELYSFSEDDWGDYGDLYEDYEGLEDEMASEGNEDGTDNLGANEDAMEDEEVVLTADEFLQKVSVGSQVFMSGTNNGGSVTWEFVEVEEENSQEEPSAEDDTSADEEPSAQVPSEEEPSV